MGIGTHMRTTLHEMTMSVLCAVGTVMSRVDNAVSICANDPLAPGETAGQTRLAHLGLKSASCTLAISSQRHIPVVLDQTTQGQHVQDAACLSGALPGFWSHPLKCIRPPWWCWKLAAAHRFGCRLQATAAAATATTAAAAWNGGAGCLWAYLQRQLWQRWRWRRSACDDAASAGERLHQCRCRRRCRPQRCDGRLAVDMR